MSDKRSAALFGELFEFLAEMPKTAEVDQMARKLLDLTQDYDFSPYSMYADDSLIKLGLAKKTDAGDVVYNWGSGNES